MLDIEKLKYAKLTKQEYRKHIVDLIEATNKFPLTTIDQAIQGQKFYLDVAKELYRIDCEVENES